MEDHLGIVYLVDNAQQFWSELEDILQLPKDEVHTLSLLDATLKRYLALCASYHEQYLQSPLQLEHACNLMLESELFAFHSERMCEILTDEARSLIFYQVLLGHGRRRPDFFRSHKRWPPLLPLLMDHVLVEIDSDVEDTYFGNAGASTNAVAVPVPIEAKLRGLCMRLLYEVCRVQRFSVQELRIFDDAFIDYLFDLVEQTRQMQDETFNYSVIKLIVALNEQFMVASLSNETDDTFPAPAPSEPKNRVLRVLMQRTPEDLCMQLLVLKILYLLFTTKGTSEYFYTNDLCVLVDVFLRELVDLDDESESLRHTYLRVLHPLLTKTQLREIPYKRPQIVIALESLTGNSGIRDVSSTTQRLVDRCLSGDWCVHLRKCAHASSDTSAYTNSHLTQPSMSASAQLGRTLSGKSRTLKSSKSFEHLNGKLLDTAATGYSVRHWIRSLNLVASAKAPTSQIIASPIRKGSADTNPIQGTFADRHPYRLPPLHLPRQCHMRTAQPQPQRRSAPPPPKRRKPPAIPAGRTNGGATITTIRSSSGSSPLAMTTKMSGP
ncbi:hypothetical protein C8J57DRAFT_1439811 [Mycena rebaudengoi]|nr:hypothetical protein C8J57DRAFT_1439811 [Mycena rebaudengoi]